MLFIVIFDLVTLMKDTNLKLKINGNIFINRSNAQYTALFMALLYTAQYCAKLQIPGTESHPLNLL